MKKIQGLETAVFDFKKLERAEEAMAYLMFMETGVDLEILNVPKESIKHYSLIKDEYVPEKIVYDHIRFKGIEIYFFSNKENETFPEIERVGIILSTEIEGKEFRLNFENDGMCSQIRFVVTDNSRKFVQKLHKLILMDLAKEEVERQVNNEEKTLLATPKALLAQVLARSVCDSTPKPVDAVNMIFIKGREIHVGIKDNEYRGTIQSTENGKEGLIIEFFTFEGYCRIMALPTEANAILRDQINCLIIDIFEMN